MKGQKAPMLLRTAAAVAVTLLLSCRSSAPVQPFGVVTAPTPRAAWESLLRERASFTGGRGFAKVRLVTEEARKSFDARIAVDAEGRLLLEAFTPLGTTAFEFWADGDQALWVDSYHSTYWRGSLRDLTASVKVLPPSSDSRTLAMLLFGLPVTSAAGSASGETEVDADGFRYTLTTGGLAGASPADAAWRASYAPASFPPRKVSFSSGAAQVEIDYDEIGRGEGPLGPPDVPQDFTRVAPTAGP